MIELTWEDLDLMVDENPLDLRDRAWAEIERVRRKNHQQGLRLAELDCAVETLGLQRAAVLAIHGPADYGEGMSCQACIGGREEPVPWPCPTARAVGVES